jgi:hypothetical protein
LLRLHFITTPSNAFAKVMGVFFGLITIYIEINGYQQERSVEMDIVTINNRQVVVCPHCRGSGMCQFSELAHEPPPRRRVVLQCQRCGLGPFSNTGVSSGGGLRVPPRDEMTPPICRICGGKGFNAI